jgi:hypothetical protein
MRLIATGPFLTAQSMKISILDLSRAIDFGKSRPNPDSKRLDLGFV